MSDGLGGPAGPRAPEKTGALRGNSVRHAAGLRVLRGDAAAPAAQKGWESRASGIASSLLRAVVLPDAASPGAPREDRKRDLAERFEKERAARRESAAASQVERRRAAHRFVKGRPRREGVGRAALRTSLRGRSGLQPDLAAGRFAGRRGAAARPHVLRPSCVAAREAAAARGTAAASSAGGERLEPRSGIWRRSRPRGGAARETAKRGA